MQLQTSRGAAFWFVFVSASSHGLLDMLTNGGLGVALLWPVSNERFFFPIQPIEVSPLSVRRILSEAGAKVLRSEMLWVWAPALVVLCAAGLVARKNERPGPSLKAPQRRK